jgi:hypothetical protein
MEMSIHNTVAGSMVTKPEKRRRNMDMTAFVLLRRFYKVHTSLNYQNLPKTRKKRDE